MADVIFGLLDDPGTAPAGCTVDLGDIGRRLDAKGAAEEAGRCFYCYDAPCQEACPTGIDVPSFIRKIGSGNLKGAAIDILSQNVFGGSCARVCPTEILCEQACVRNAAGDEPVAIGALQRHATDPVIENGLQVFRRAAPTGRKVAVVGGGPAGLACAHRLALLGHAVTVFEARPKLGGLNEYGIAAYKLVDGFAQQEVGWILGLGGIAVETRRRLGVEITLDALRRDFDAVFLGIGLGDVNALGLEGEDLPGVGDAVSWIEQLRQAHDPCAVPVGRRVVVIGGGNTAIDVAVQSRRLGAEEVTIAYRRGPQQMGATGHEQALAKAEGVALRFWSRPVRLVARDGRLTGVELEEAGGRRVTLAADTLFKAIGQKLAAPLGASGPALAGGRIAVDENRMTSLPGVFAGGDCAGTGIDLTVWAVEDGKRAALAIASWLKTV